MRSTKIRIHDILRSSGELTIRDNSGVIRVVMSRWNLIARYRLARLNGETVTLIGCYRMEGTRLLSPFAQDTATSSPSSDSALTEP